MTIKQRKLAMQLYNRRIKEDPEYSLPMFEAEFDELCKSETGNSLAYADDPFSIRLGLSNLWKALKMDINEIIRRFDMKPAEFSDRFWIPYRTLQAWMDGTNPCPVYIKVMLCELLGIITVVDPHTSWYQRATYYDEEPKVAESAAAYGTVYSIDEIRRRLTPIFKKHGVRKAVLFGSYAKGQANTRSDIDLLVDSGLSGLAFFGLLNDVAEAFSVPVDLIDKSQVARNSRMSEEIINTGVMIYA